jgi:hypothetical protein
VTRPLLLLLAFGAVAAVIVISAIVRTARERIASVGLARLIVRWFLGHPWHGGHITDAGWNREGRKTLTVTGHARRFWHRKGKHRAAIRTAETLGPLAAVYGLVFYRAATIGLLALAAAAALAIGAWRARRAWQARTWRRSWLYPLHKTIAPMLNVPLAVNPESYLRLAPDRSRVTLELPPGFRSTRDMERLEQAVSATLAIEAPDVEWDRSGAKPYVTFTSSRTPARVALADIRGDLTGAGADELVLGIGKRGQAIVISLHEDAPHVALSMGPGGGKTMAGRLAGAQVLYKGGLLAVLNIKQIGYGWTRGLPNAVHARTLEEIAVLLAWLDGERQRREDVAFAAADAEDEIHANVGPRIFVIFEEMNLTMPGLRKQHPEAAEALGGLSYAGRQTRENVMPIAQRYSALAAGGGDIRASVGTRILGRYDTAAWKMLAAEHKMPACTDQPGRVQVVTSVVRECQIAMLKGAEAHELALAGTVAAWPADMPLRPLPDPGVMRTPIAAPPGETGPVTPGSPSPGSPPQIDGVSLADISALQIVPMSKAALKTARRRDGAFPRPVGWDSQTALYDPEEMLAWHQQRKATS